MVVNRRDPVGEVIADPVPVAGAELAVSQAESLVGKGKEGRSLLWSVSIVDSCSEAFTPI